MCKFLGRMLGFEAPKVPEYKPPAPAAPAAQAVNLDDGKTGEELAESKRRKKRGFQSTRAQDTILGGSSGDGKRTLG